MVTGIQFTPSGGPKHRSRLGDSATVVYDDGRRVTVPASRTFALNLAARNHLSNTVHAPNVWGTV